MPSPSAEMTREKTLDKKTQTDGPKRIKAAVRALTLREAACLLDLPEQTLRDKIKRGELRAYIVTTWPKYPWVGHAYRRRRMYVRFSELERWMQTQEREHPGGGGRLTGSVAVSPKRRVRQEREVVSTRARGAGEGEAEPDGGQTTGQGT